MTPRFRPLLPAMLSLVLAFAAPRAAAAQVDTVSAAADSLYTIRLTDGSVLHGRIVDEAGASFTVVTHAGVTVRVERAQVESITRARIVEGRVWPRDPNHTRLFFGPTARSVGARRGYFGVYEIFFPFLTYGVTSNLSLSAGTPIIPEVIGEFWYFAPKLTLVERERLSVATGVLAVAVDGETAGVVYGVGTFGDSDQAVTAGVGYGFADGDLHNDAVFMLGGELRMGAGTKLITENYLVPGFDDETGAVASGGIRFFGERLSADLGVAFPLNDCTGSCWFPLVNFVYSF